MAEDLYDGFPVITASGPITAESLVELGKLIREYCENAEVKGVIIDCKQIEGALSSQSLFKATPEFTAVVGQQIKVAYINKPKCWPPDVDQFSRDLAYNRGGHLELFETKDDAVGWLQQPLL